MAPTIHMTLFECRDKTGDLTFDNGKGLIRAHKCVLATVSVKFEDYFFGPNKLDDSAFIKSKGSSAGELNEFIKFCYLSEMNLSVSHFDIGAIYCLAKHWNVTDCITKCESFVKLLLDESSNVFCGC